MLNKGKGETEKTKKGKFRNKMFFYFILIFMLIVSFFVYEDEKNTSVQVGNFGGSQKEKNISFSHAAENIFIGGRFGKA